MKTIDVRNWLGVYFLLTTVSLGVYILLFGDTRLLPINKNDSADAFQIIIPVFVAQLTTVFSWFTNVADVSKDATVSIPTWIVKTPPLLVVGVIVVTIISMIASGNNGSISWVDASKFKTIVTFCVTILNATTVLVVAKVFGKPAPLAP